MNDSSIALWMNPKINEYVLINAIDDLLKSDMGCGAGTLIVDIGA